LRGTWRGLANESPGVSSDQCEPLPRAASGSEFRPRLLPRREHAILAAVRIIARRALRDFWERHPDAEQPLRAWYHDARNADWRSPTDIKRVYANASIIGANRVVFNIKGNTYRLVVAINYRHRICYVRFVGSHHAYNRIDVATV